MLIRRKPGWELPEKAATPEHVFVNRRRLLKGVAAGSILAASAPLAARAGLFGDDPLVEHDDPTADLYPVARNERYVLDRELTDIEITAKYNNFYEFGSHKQIWQAAQKLEIRPWTVTINGMVENEMVVEIDDLIRRMSI